MAWNMKSYEIYQKQIAEQIKMSLIKQRNRIEYGGCYIFRWKEKNSWRLIKNL
jgi:hypothetical protein